MLIAKLKNDLVALPTLSIPSSWPLLENSLRIPFQLSQLPPDSECSPASTAISSEIGTERSSMTRIGTTSCSSKTAKHAGFPRSRSKGPVCRLPMAQSRCLSAPMCEPPPGPPCFCAGGEQLLDGRRDPTGRNPRQAVGQLRERTRRDAQAGENCLFVGGIHSPFKSRPFCAESTYNACLSV
jgi:hypothetical protein